MLPYITVSAQSMIEPMCIVIYTIEYLQQCNVSAALITFFNTVGILYDVAVYNNKNNYINAGYQIYAASTLFRGLLLYGYNSGAESI